MNMDIQNITKLTGLEKIIGDTEWFRSDAYYFHTDFYVMHYKRRH